MFRGTVDRAGTREGKKTSLRKTGKDKKASSANTQDDTPKMREEPIPTLKERTSGFATFDCGANLVNRHLEADHGRVIQRAVQAGVHGMAIITNDFEKSEASINMSQANEGTVYSVVGIHPNNISAKKMSDKLFNQLISQLRNFAVKPHVIGMYGGLDYDRDYGLKFPQEKFLKTQIKLANELGLPFILQDFGNGEGLLEVMKESRSEIIRGMVYCFNSSSKFLEKLIEMDFYISFNGLVCETSDKGDQVRDYVTKVPLDRLIILSESPNLTPQTIPDEHIRKMPNEPSNLIYAITMAAKCLNKTPEELASIINENSKRFYGLNQPIVNETTATETTDTTTTTTSPITSSPVVLNTKPTSTPTSSSTNTPTLKSNKKKQQLLKKQQQQEELESEEELELESESESEEEDNSRIINRLDKSELDNLYYCCKQCRTKLFKLGDIKQHEEKAKVLDHSIIRKKDVASSAKKCKSLFVESAEWVKSDRLPLVNCPRCDSKLGSFDKVAGEQCSCGHTVQGCVRVPKSRVEVVLLGEDGDLIDLALLNLSDDDDDQDGLPTRGGKKKQQRKKNVKKSNKSNFSNYRNKDTTGHSAAKKQQPKFMNVDDDSDKSDKDKDTDEEDN